MSKITKQILSDILNAAEYRRMKIDTIKPAPYNPRVDLQPDSREYQDIKNSILNHGMIQPIVYNKRTGNAVGGNQRLKILKELGRKEITCAVIDVPLMREMEISVALNKLDNLWDREKLRDIMIHLKENDYDPTKTAFDQHEVDKLTQDMNQSIEDFFEDEDIEPKAETVKKYQCPYCGTVFTK